MQDLETLKALQVVYQTKFSALLKLQEELNTSGNDPINSQEYNLAKEEWIKAGVDLKAHLDQNSV